MATNNVNVSPNVVKIIILCVIALIAFSASFYTIDTGERGVVLRFGKLTKVSDEGLHLRIPFVDEIEKMSVRDNKMGVTLEVSSSDMQTIALEVNLVYSINPNEVDRVYKTYKKDIEYTLLRPTLAEKINAVIAEYPIEEFVEKRAEISNRINSAFTAQVDGSGIFVKSLLITNHDFSDEYDKAIESKKVAEQGALTAKFTLERMKLEAEAQKVKQASLSPMVLQEMAINKWDGHLPEYFSGSELPFLKVK
jgi:regulator of protease activity HflC (stomatin/prohibitin superfamily)